MERVMFLRSAPLCADLPDPALRTIAEVAHERACGPGEVIFREEDLGTEMYLVIEGEVEVRTLGRRPAENARGEALGALLATLGRGECVGEMSVLDDQPRSASVSTVGEVDVLTIQKEDLRDAIALCPDLAFGLFRVLSGRLRDAAASRSGKHPSPERTVERGA
jgi:CRP-like cAMP-binding protein